MTKEQIKIKFLEDRIKTLEKTLESHAKILARFQMTEGKDDIEIYETVGGGFDFDEKEKKIRTDIAERRKNHDRQSW